MGAEGSHTGSEVLGGQVPQTEAPELDTVKITASGPNRSNPGAAVQKR